MKRKETTWPTKIDVAGLKAEIAELRAELRTEIAGVRTEISVAKTEMLKWMVVLFRPFYVGMIVFLIKFFWQ